MLNVRNEWRIYTQKFENFLQSPNMRLREEIRNAVQRLHKAYKQEFIVGEEVIFVGEIYIVLGFDNKKKTYEIIRSKKSSKSRPRIVHWASLTAKNGEEQLTLF